MTFENIFEYNGKRLPAIGETIFLIAREVRTNSIGRKYRVRDPHKVECVKACVDSLTISMEVENKTNSFVVRYTGKASTTDRGYLESLPFVAGSFSYSQEEGRNLLEQFQEKGLEFGINGQIQSADYMPYPTEPLAVLGD